MHFFPRDGHAALAMTPKKRGWQAALVVIPIRSGCHALGARNDNCKTFVAFIIAGLLQVQAADSLGRMILSIIITGKAAEGFTTSCWILKIDRLLPLWYKQPEIRK